MNEVLAVFVQYKNKYFTQTDFVKALSKSNPFVNKTLRKLCDLKKIKRERSGNKYFYKYNQ